MKNIIKFIANRYHDIYKAALFVISIIVIVSLFPKEGKFMYDYHKGKPWMHKDLIAPFDFAIEKAPEEIDAEKGEIVKNIKPYFKYDSGIKNRQINNYKIAFEQKWTDRSTRGEIPVTEKGRYKEFGEGILDSLFLRGIIESHPTIEQQTPGYDIIVIKRNIAREYEVQQLFNVRRAENFIRENIANHPEYNSSFLMPLLIENLAINITYDEKATENEKQSHLNNISTTRGMVQLGERIISRGELVTPEKFQVIESLKKEYEKALGTSARYYLILFGQFIVVILSILVLILFLVYFRKDIFADNKKLVLILLLITLMVFVTSKTLAFNPDFIYLVPLCLVPVIIRSFFDTRLALFVHIVTIINIGFLVPNSFEYVFYHLIAGIIAIISIYRLEKRSQFFLTSVMIFVTYSSIYLGIFLIQEGSLNNINTINFAYFAGNAVLTMFAYPLIFIFERLFGMVTDVSLLELTNTNHPLLRELATKAPGTFQHSLQVANLAEEAIYAIGGKSILVRAGAMYHDIGKAGIPVYFTENQSPGMNPHDDLNYDDSAKIVVSHVLKGIQLAKKYRIPEQVIDFIRTHHGTRKAEYFYTLKKRDTPDEALDEDLYTYPGPPPYSKETAVLMMADSVEAASRSIEKIDEEKINELVENLINRQMEAGQFNNANITLRDISTVKKIFKKKLLNIYHIRISYPEAQQVCLF